MAEAVRPETDYQTAEYLRRRINFNQVSRALRSLRDLNLIVIKPQAGSADLLELHPLVREFIRRTFARDDRVSFIDAIIEVYFRFMGLHKNANERRSIAVLQHWTEGAELCVEAGKFQQALDSLYEVKEAIYGSDAPGEFARAARVVFRNIYWTKHSEYKHFDAVFNTYFNILVNLGLTEEHSDMRPPSHRRTRDTSIIVISSLTYIGSDQNMSKRLNGGKRGRT